MSRPFSENPLIFLGKWAILFMTDYDRDNIKILGYERNLFMQRKLRTGCAYHGNRMLSHAIADMKEISRADMDVVVHMLSHTDWERHSDVMGEIFKASEAEGLEVWVDNWGIGGGAGDKAHFLAYHPEAHTYYGNGQMHRILTCLNAPSYRQFVKDWVNKVAELGAKTVFWDEPSIPKIASPDGRIYSACTCPTCRKIFEERFGKPMPEFMDDDVIKFRNDVLVEFHDFITAYAHSVGLRSAICLMPTDIVGMNDPRAEDNDAGIDLSRIFGIEHISSVGTDPYWLGSTEGPYNPYERIYNISKACVDAADKFNKDSHIWIQGFTTPRGREDEIIIATEAAYDAGARTILSWGFRGCEANNYRAENPERSWMYTVEAMKRVKAMERDRILEENRKLYMK